MDETLYLEFNVAQLNFEQKRYVEASRALEFLLSHDPDNASVRTLLARSYYHAAMLTKAEEQARVLLQRDPTDHYAQLVLGRALQRQSRHDEAREPLRLAALFSDDDDTI
ncbi:tetratricopeptide repeat protein [Janibacter sp. G56]|uniref:tetratricopeptide repeat protein n=1 Tax=Janibacter sp. G56 TaxID=3418717 RepID=UPI003D0036F9